MYERVFSLKAPPFRNTPTRNMFFDRGGRRDVVEAMRLLLEHGDGVILLTGEVGSGKTTIIRNLVAALEEFDAFQVAYIPNPTGSPEGVLCQILTELSGGHRPEGGVCANGERDLASIYQSLASCALERFSSGKRLVIIVDEAHLASIPTLEQLRLVANIEHSEVAVVQIVLVGQPEILDLLDRHELRALKSRVAHHFRLEALSRDDAFHYLNHRVRCAGYEGVLFTREVSDAIYEAAGNTPTPRRLNVIADKTLVVCAASGYEKPRTEHVIRVSRELSDAEGGWSDIVSPAKIENLPGLDEVDEARHPLWSLKGGVFRPAVLAAALAALSAAVAVVATMRVSESSDSNTAQIIEASSEEKGLLQERADGGVGPSQSRDVAKPKVEKGRKGFSSSMDSGGVAFVQKEGRKAGESSRQHLLDNPLCSGVKKDGIQNGQYIHLATFRQKVMAESIMLRVAQEGGAECVFISPLADKISYGVFLGPFGTYSTAKRAFDRLHPEFNRFKPYILGDSYFHRIAIFKSSTRRVEQ